MSNVHGLIPDPPGSGRLRDIFEQSAPGTVGRPPAKADSTAVTARTADASHAKKSTTSQSSGKAAVKEQAEPGTGMKAGKLPGKPADYISFSPEMHTQVKQLRKDAIRYRNFRDDLETRFLSFLSIEPSLDDIRKAAMFAASSIWDILKKTHPEDEEDEEIPTYLLGMLIKIHSEYTYEHSARVMDWTIALAEELGIEDQEELENLGKAAFFRDIGMIGSAINEEDRETHKKISEFLEESRESLKSCSSLHDIGKMRIPQEIINKAAPLTDEEFAIIKTHPIIGVEIVLPYPTLHKAIPGIKHHHEKYDGTGYPDSLKGTDIPFPARIITVTDSFDAMTEDRPYRKALSYSDAINELLRLSGKQFDPDLVIPFIRALIRKGDIDPGTLEIDIDINTVMPPKVPEKINPSVLDKLKRIVEGKDA